MCTENLSKSILNNNVNLKISENFLTTLEWQSKSEVRSKHLGGPFLCELVLSSPTSRCWIKWTVAMDISNVIIFIGIGTR